MLFLINTLLNIDFLKNNKKLLVKLFKIYIIPIIEYCSPLYYPIHQKEINNIESIQRYFTKKLFKKSHSQCYIHRLHNLGLPSLESRLILLDLLHLYKVHTGLLQCN